MDKEGIAKWLDAIGKDGKITRCKLKCDIYSNLALKETETISLDSIEIIFSGIESPEKSEKKNGLFLTLHCEAVIETNDIDIAVSIFNHNLTVFFVLSRAEFIVKEPIHRIVECNKEWIGTPSIHIEGSGFRDLNEGFIKRYHSKLETLSRARSDSRDIYKKLRKAIHLLKNAIELETLWSTESFLNYYKVIEITADELKQKEYRPLIFSSDLVEDLVNLIADNTQRIKVYFLYVVLKLTEFDKQKVIGLGTIRNKIAHSSYQPSPEEMWLCKNVSFTVFSKFIEIIELLLIKQNG